MKTDCCNQKKIEILPGERFKDFTRRVDQQFQADYHSAARAARPKSAGKRRNEEQRKLKKRAKIEKQQELYGGRDFDDLRDEVKFGEVADAPPVFNRIPKVRGKEKQVQSPDRRAYHPQCIHIFHFNPFH